MSWTSASRNSALVASALALGGCAHAAQRPLGVRGSSDSTERALVLSPSGNTLVRCQPTDADLFVDGILQGKARDFDGTHRLLALSPGAHEVELRRAGYRSVQVEVQAAGGRQTLDVALQPVKL
ncbi:MAG: hypothetical protein ACYCWW_12310 [Deltaproteobacteria bacterium]